MYVQTYFRFNMGRVPSSCSDFSSSSRFVCVAFFCLVDFCCFWGWGCGWCWGYVCAAVCNVLVVFILRDSQAPRKKNNNSMQRVRRQGKKNALIKFDADAPISTKYGWVPKLTMLYSNSENHVCQLLWILVLFRYLLTMLS